MEVTFNTLPEAVTELHEKLKNIERLLLQKSDNSPRSEEELLTIQQAGKFLNLSVPTLYGYVQRSAIPVCKRGKRLYFSKQELTDWIKAGRKKTAAEIDAEAETYLKKKGNNA